MMWRWLDAVAHWLYSPGRRYARVRWWHAIHLIPGSWLAWVCDRHEARLLRPLAAGQVAWHGVTAPTGWVVGQPVDSGWTAGVLTTRRWRCDHATVSGTGLVGAPMVPCGCEMAEV